MDTQSVHPSPLRPSHKDNLQSLTGSEIEGKMSGNGWQHIRSLDVTENWHERTAVISKTDHQNHTTWAREVVDDMVDNAQRKFVHAPHTNTTPTNPSEAPPTQTRDEDYRYMNEFSDEDFQGSAAQFDVEYLENIGTTNPTHMSALTRESLYVKFDPLVGGTHPPSTHKSPHRGVRTHKLLSNDLIAMDTPPHGTPAQPQDLLTSSPARLDTPQTSVSDTPDFPSQPAHLPSSLSTSPSSHLAQLPAPSSSHSPPAPSSHLSPSTSASGRRGAGGTGTLVEVLKYGEEDMAAMVEQTRQEERAKYEAQVQLLKEELSRKEVAAQRRVDRVQRECQAIRNDLKSHITDKQKLENDLDQLKELLKANESTQEILHTHYDDLRAKVKDIEQQRETAVRDFEGLDKSFTDLHQRYLRLKLSSDTQQQHEKVLKSQIARLEESCFQAEEKCKQLQEDATQQLNHFNSSHDSLKKQHTQDVAITKATVRKLELQVDSLKRSLEEKTREKDGLTQLCDELLVQINPAQAP